VVELKPDDVRTLVDLGFLAVSYGLSDKAAPIFAAVRATRPTQEAGFIGGALVSLARGEIDGAISALRALPPTDAARTFLAIALNRSGDREAAREILTDVAIARPARLTPLWRVSCSRMRKSRQRRCSDNPCNLHPFVPAQAGTQACSISEEAFSLDSRFRGDEREGGEVLYIRPSPRKRGLRLGDF
jgi:hypothetical protein